MRTPVLGFCPTGVTASTNGFLHPNGTYQIATTETTIKQMVAPCDGKIFNLHVGCTTAPGTGLTRTFSVMKNGVESAVTVVFAATDTAKSDLTHSVSVSAGDTISIVTYASGTTTSSGVFRYGFVFEATTVGQSLVATACVSVNLSASATRYMNIQGTDEPDATATNVQQVVAAAGTFKNARLTLSGNAGSAASGKSYTVTLVKNDVDTAITFTITETATSGSDLTHSVSVAAGDYLHWKIVPAGTPTVRTFSVSMEFDPTTVGESLFSLISSAGNPTLTNNTVSFQSPVGSHAGTGTTDASKSSVVPVSAKVVRQYIKIITGPGAGNSWTFSAFKNNVAQTATTITHPTLTGNGSVVASTSPGDTLSWGINPSGSAFTAPGAFTLGGAFYIPPITAAPRGASNLRATVTKAVVTNYNVTAAPRGASNLRGTVVKGFGASTSTIGGARNAATVTRGVPSTSASFGASNLRGTITRAVPASTATVGGARNSATISRAVPVTARALGVAIAAAGTTGTTRVTTSSVGGARNSATVIVGKLVSVSARGASHNVAGIIRSVPVSTSSLGSGRLTSVTVKGISVTTSSRGASKNLGTAVKGSFCSTSSLGASRNRVTAVKGLFVTTSSKGASNNRANMILGVTVTSSVRGVGLARYGSPVYPKPQPRTGKLSFSKYATSTK